MCVLTHSQMYDRMQKVVTTDLFLRLCRIVAHVIFSVFEIAFGLIYTENCVALKKIKNLNENTKSMTMSFPIFGIQWDKLDCGT